MSIRLSHLALLLALTTVLAAVGGVIATYRVAEDELRDVLDDDLESQGTLLARLLAAEQVQPTAGQLEQLLARIFEPDDEGTLWVNIYDLRSGHHVSNLQHAFMPGEETDGSVRRRLLGHDWHGYQRREGDYIVQLLRRDDLYMELQSEMLEDVVTPAVIGSVINLVLLAMLMLLVLWPLTKLVRELEARSADSLAPLVLRTPAKEIAVLRDTLNRMIGRVDAVLRREREFTGDVAHELRTPLATLKLELADPRPDVPALRTEINRLARVVTQLLTLARVEQGLSRQAFGQVSLSDVATGVIAHDADRAGRAGLIVRSHISPCTIAGDVALLEILLQNLLNNVIAHCPPGTQVDVHVEARDDGAVLQVSDTGAGIAEALRVRMNDGLTRLDRKAEGLGLGLAICRKIAQAHRASIAFLALDDGAPGLRVVVRFAP